MFRLRASSTRTSNSTTQRHSLIALSSKCSASPTFSTAIRGALLSRLTTIVSLVVAESGFCSAYTRFPLASRYLYTGAAASEPLDRSEEHTSELQSLRHL